MRLPASSCNSGEGAQKASFLESPGAPLEDVDAGEGTDRARREGRIGPHLVVIAFSPGQAKWKSLEHTLPGTDFKVGSKASLPQT